MKTQQHTEQQSRRNPALHALVQDWHAADKGRKHEAFESGSSERRSLTRVLRMDKKR
ncbi:hypothetical protein SNE35_04050 [Paucibacter sp. R3-3]|uniref:Uncharacterized protein n=1 Tax=Roseateles agri TaxID=3098619 RepID=A0ABU5DBK9_9BURK|nr:hypothetical protein [Paucibacter sp. R3-3]MDY0743660.1 hypothetical protein [Paucibacter sp. R3-3]